ncbi:MAG: hypothetical protein SFX18_04250 [Pirellulales bacterium]|nr:hypothetical protein [Pirellulales bacterium]
MGRYQNLYQRSKLMLIPLLALVLGWVVWNNYIARQDPLGLDIAGEDAGQGATASPDVSAVRERRHWPIIPLETITLHNPFERPAAFLVDGPGDNSQLSQAEQLTHPMSADEGTQATQSTDPADSAFISARGGTRPGTLSLPRLQAVYQSAAGWSALVNNQIVRPGERLSAGALVREIHAGGIILEQAAPAKSQAAEITPAIEHVPLEDTSR